MYRRQGSSCVGQLLFLAVGAIGVLIILWGMGLINPLDTFFGRPKANVNAPGPAIIQQLKARNEWITHSHHADQLIEASLDGNFLQDLLFGDRLLLQARGEVAAGIDMSQLADESVVINGTAITMTLPPAKVIYTRLDNSATRIYDRERGWLSRGDVNLESTARAYAEQSILQSACESGVLDRAALQAQQNVEELLKAVGYTTVIVYVSKVGDCVASAPGIEPLPSNVTPAPTPSAPIPVATPTGGLPQPVATPTPGGIILPTIPGSNSLSGTVVPLAPTP